LEFLKVLPHYSASWPVARADGSLRYLLAWLGRVDVLVIDDWAMAPMQDAERRDFWRSPKRCRNTPQLHRAVPFANGRADRRRRHRCRSL
jgi:hypothetical protein